MKWSSSDIGQQLFGDRRDGDWSFPLPESDPPKIAANYILFGAFSIATIFQPHNGILTSFWLNTSRIWTRKAFSWIHPDTSRSHRRPSMACWRRACVISKRKSMCDNKWLFYRRWCFEGLLLGVRFHAIRELAGARAMRNESGWYEMTKGSKGCTPAGL